MPKMNVDLSKLVTAEDNAAEAKTSKITAIKAEARRRIENVMSDVKQRNSLATTARNGAMSEEDKKKWAEIERLRKRSNEIEAMSTLPDDVSDDALWR